MPPPGYEPFLAAIRDNPESDLPRLVYADWLDEHGDPMRAEFIRLQCELAGMGLEWATGGRGRSDREQALLRRQNEMWSAYGPAWLGELPRCPGTSVRFSRGFATAADVEHPGGLMRVGDQLFGVAPISWLSFRNCPATAFKGPLGRPWFAAVRKLSAAWKLPLEPHGDDVAEALAESPHASGITELILRDADLSDAGVLALGRAGRLAQLTRADFAHNRIGNGGAEVLADGLSPERLTLINLARNPILAEYRRMLSRRFPVAVKFDSAG